MKAAKELKELPAEELKIKLKEWRKELLKLNMQVATGANPASPGKLRQTKKNIARALTLLQRKEAR